MEAIAFIALMKCQACRSRSIELRFEVERSSATVFSSDVSDQQLSLGSGFGLDTSVLEQDT